MPRIIDQVERKTSIKFFSKIFCCTYTVGCQKFVQFVCYTPDVFFIESVDHSWRNLYLIHSCPTSTSRIFITRTRFRAWSPLIVVNTTPRLTMICHGTPLILSSFHSSLNCHIFEHICVKRLILACFGALWINVPLRYSKICLFIIYHLSQIWPLLSNIYCPKSSAKIH